VCASASALVIDDPSTMLPGVSAGSNPRASAAIGPLAPTPPRQRCLPGLAEKTGCQQQLCVDEINRRQWQPGAQPIPATVTAQSPEKRPSPSVVSRVSTHAQRYRVFPRCRCLRRWLLTGLTFSQATGPQLRTEVRTQGRPSRLAAASRGALRRARSGLKMSSWPSGDAVLLCSVEGVC
jgi:hypothetical protein